MANLHEADDLAVVLRGAALFSVPVHRRTRTHSYWLIAAAAMLGIAAASPAAAAGHAILTSPSQLSPASNTPR